jgi:hypothetical protein
MTLRWVTWRANGEDNAPTLDSATGLPFYSGVRRFTCELNKLSPPGSLRLARPSRFPPVANYSIFLSGDPRAICGE